MKQFSFVVFDFVHAIVKFHYVDLLIVLEGGDASGNLFNMKETSAKKWIDQKQSIEGEMVFLVMLAESVDIITKESNEVLRTLLNHLKGVFKEL